MVYVECYADKLLVQVLGVPDHLVLHARCKGNVMNGLRRVPCGLGMVDEDPGAAQPQEMSNYCVCSQLQYTVRLIQTTQPQRHLIVLKPRLEDWLYHCAGAAKLDPSRFGLPDTPAELRDKPRFDKSPGFHNFLRALSEVSPELQTLRRWVHDILHLNPA